MTVHAARVSVEVRFWQEYLEPLDSSTHSGGDSGAKVPSMETDASQVLLPLGETTLVNNVGLPIVVVITKARTLSYKVRTRTVRTQQCILYTYYIHT